MSDNDSIILRKEPDSCSNLPTYGDHTAVIADLVCPGDIRRMLQWLHAAGETFEVRTLNSQKDKWTKISCGYFRDAEVATEAVVDHVGDYDPAQVYVTLNPTMPSLYARVRDHIEPKQSGRATAICSSVNLDFFIRKLLPAGAGSDDRSLSKN